MKRTACKGNKLLLSCYISESGKKVDNGKKFSYAKKANAEFLNSHHLALILAQRMTDEKMYVINLSKMIL